MVSGPYGKGIDFSDHGVKIAFAGGTGVLTFIDLVARIAMKVLNGLKESSRVNKSEIFNPTGDVSHHTFILYVSFMDEKSAIALELLTNLNNFCERNQLRDFKLVVRLSSQKGARWDDAYIRKELAQYDRHIQNVMVCGPPPMTETFDRLFTRLAAENYNGLTK